VVEKKRGQFPMASLLEARKYLVENGMSADPQPKKLWEQGRPQRKIPL